MKKPKLPNSVRKHIRREKAKIKKMQLSDKEKEKMVGQLYQKFLKPEKHENTGNS